MHKFICHTIGGFFLLIMLGSCGTPASKNLNVDLPKSTPMANISTYTDALEKFGLLTQVYNRSRIVVQSLSVGDDTGASRATGGEVQADITKIVQNALNSMGGSILYVPYDPNYILNQITTSYLKDTSQLTKPDVVITGAITGFDRGLETKSDSMDLGAGANFDGVSKYVPSTTVEGQYGSFGKKGKASISLDFMMKDFNTQAGVPHMSISNKMDVYKGIEGSELGLTLFGLTYGEKGSVKRVQGRHDAVRLLVQVSMLQLLGRYLELPYWRVMGEDTNPDAFVVRKLEETFYEMTAKERTQTMENWLYQHGYDTSPSNGSLTIKTKAALLKYNSNRHYNGDFNDFNTFRSLYYGIPISRKTIARNKKWSQLVANATAVPSTTKVDQQDSKKQKSNAEKLNVEVWTNAKTYLAGQKVKLHIRGNKNFYAVVLYQTAAGEILQLLPNPYQSNNYFSGNSEYIIPSKNDQFELEVLPPYGKEDFIIYADTQPISKLNLEKSGVIYRVKTKASNITRSIKLKSKSGFVFEKVLHINTSQ